MTKREEVWKVNASSKGGKTTSPRGCDARSGALEKTKSGKKARKKEGEKGEKVWVEGKTLFKKQSIVAGLVRLIPERTFWKGPPVPTQQQPRFPAPSLAKRPSTSREVRGTEARKRKVPDLKKSGKV